MPDFGPEETKKRMKEEPQNNWETVRHELYALGFHPSHEIIMDYINQGSPESILDDIEDVRKFLMSYPALIWLLFKIDVKNIYFSICNFP